MKKNMISVLILALLIVNVVLTGVMMFSVTSASNKTAALVDDIAAALNIELASDSEDVESTVATVSIADTSIYDINDEFMVLLKKDTDGADHYGKFSISLSMNIKADGYKEYGEGIQNYESKIKSIIVDVVGNYSKSEAEAPGAKDMMLAEILKEIQQLYDSKFVYEVVFRDVLFM